MFTKFSGVWHLVVLETLGTVNILDPVNAVVSCKMGRARKMWMAVCKGAVYIRARRMVDARHMQYVSLM